MSSAYKTKFIGISPTTALKRFILGLFFMIIGGLLFFKLSFLNPDVCIIVGIILALIGAMIIIFTIKHSSDTDKLRAKIDSKTNIFEIKIKKE